MKKHLLLAALCALFANVASAVTLTLAQALDLRAGLTALDGYQKEISQGDAPARVVQVAYKFPADARWKIFSALTSLKPALDTFDAARTDLQRRSKLAADDATAREAIEAEAANLLQRTVEVTLPTLKRAELALGDNPIPGSVLAALAPIIADMK